MVNKKEKFIPKSDKNQLIINNKPKTPTALHYQKGKVSDGRIALRFFKKDRIIKTLVSKNKKSWDSIKNRNIWDVIYDFGGQNPDQAHIQREVSLTQICRNYFEKLGYKVEEQPYLVENTPDLLITKGKHCCYIEIKAYFGRTIIGEPEVAQVLKYFAISGSDTALTAKIDAGELFPPKFMLITTGKLLSEEKNSLLNGELRDINKEEDISLLIKKKYKKLGKDIGWGRSLEARDTRSIYNFGWKKIKKYYMPDNWGNPNILQLTGVGAEKLDKLIEEDDGNDIYLIPAGVFAHVLTDSGMKSEATIFGRIEKTWMERLVLNRNLINMD
ncbi:MAG: hypothetical protein GY870_20835 [archaeon]|nr:hypothetical protein [archaeon]